MQLLNLNDHTIPDEGQREHWQKLSYKGKTSGCDSVTVHFRDVNQSGESTHKAKQNTQLDAQKKPRTG